MSSRRTTLSLFLAAMEASSGNAVFGNDPGYRMRSPVAYSGQWSMSRRCETQHEQTQKRYQLKHMGTGEGCGAQLSEEWAVSKNECLAQITAERASCRNIHRQSYTKTRADLPTSYSGYTDGYQSSGYESARDAPYRSSR